MMFILDMPSRNVRLEHLKHELACCGCLSAISGREGHTSVTESLLFWGQNVSNHG